jgi:hypothetical protein
MIDLAELNFVSDQHANKTAIVSVAVTEAVPNHNLRERTKLV